MCPTFTHYRQLQRNDTQTPRQESNLDPGGARPWCWPRHHCATDWIIIGVILSSKALINVSIKKQDKTVKHDVILNHYFFSHSMCMWYTCDANLQILISFFFSQWRKCYCETVAACTSSLLFHHTDAAYFWLPALGQTPPLCSDWLKCHNYVVFGDWLVE